MIFPKQVYLAIEPVDMRWGIERLSCHVQHAIGRSPCEGSAYAFTNQQRSRLKLLIWDATGVWLCQRRLHQGLFHWPKTGETLSLRHPHLPNPRQTVSLTLASLVCLPVHKFVHSSTNPLRTIG